MTYYAFQIYDTGEGTIKLEVDSDVVKLLTRLAETLNEIRDDGYNIETIEVGRVEADSVDLALDAVRAGEWDESTYGWSDTRRSTKYGGGPFVGQS